MNSKTTFDFEVNEKEYSPVLILDVKRSDDVRDKVAISFIEQLGYESRLLTIEAVGSGRYIVRPLNGALGEKLTAGLDEICNK